MRHKILHPVSCFVSLNVWYLQAWESCLWTDKHSSKVLRVVEMKIPYINTVHSKVWEIHPFASTPNLFSFAFSVWSKPNFHESTCEISGGPDQRGGVLGLERPKLRFDLCPGCKKVVTFRTNTRGCCRRRKGETETREETAGQNSSAKHRPTTFWSGKTFQVLVFFFSRGRSI